MNSNHRITITATERMQHPIIITNDDCENLRQEIRLPETHDHFLFTMTMRLRDRKKRTRHHLRQFKRSSKEYIKYHTSFYYSPIRNSFCNLSQINNIEPTRSCRLANFHPQSRSSVPFIRVATYQSRSSDRLGDAEKTPCGENSLPPDTLIRETSPTRGIPPRTFSCLSVGTGIKSKKKFNKQPE